MIIYQNKYPKGYYVYAYIRNKTTQNGPAGSPYYIGKGKYNRAWIPHHTPRDHSYILILEQNLTEIGAFALERRLIKWYGRLDLGTGILHNKTGGGEGVSGLTQTHITRHKISMGNKGKVRNDQMKQRYSAAKKGTKMSENQKQHLSKLNTGKILSCETKQKIKANNGMRGKTHTKEAKEKIRAAATGRPSSRKGTVCSEETKKKMSDSKKGIPMSVVTRNKLKLYNKEKNSQFGSMWITNGIVNMKIKREDVIPQDWYKGRVFNKGYKNVRK